MAKISMNIVLLQSNINKWVELEEECLNIVKSTDDELAYISEESLKTPMLKNEFDKLRSIYAQIERRLTTNINEIKNFLENQINRYDTSGYQAAEATSNVSDSISMVPNNNAGNMSAPVTNIADASTEAIGVNFNTSSVNANKQGFENLTVNDNSLANPLENVGNETINTTNKDKNLTANIHGLAEAGNENLLNNGATVAQNTLREPPSGISSESVSSTVDSFISNNFANNISFNPGEIKLDDREKEGFIDPIKY